LEREGVCERERREKWNGKPRIRKDRNVHVELAQVGLTRYAEDVR
jgi:hypothetical protein